MGNIREINNELLHMKQKNQLANSLMNIAMFQIFNLDNKIQYLEERFAIYQTMLQSIKINLNELYKYQHKYYINIENYQLVEKKHNFDHLIIYPNLGFCANCINILNKNKSKFQKLYVLGKKGGGCDEIIIPLTRYWIISDFNHKNIKIIDLFDLEWMNIYNKYLNNEYIIETNQKTLMNNLLIDYIKYIMFQNSWSENKYRLNMMNAALENTKVYIKKLNLDLSKERQHIITNDMNLLFGVDN